MQDTARRHDLDWVRIIAFGLLIAYHTGMYYVTWDWHVKSPFASHTLEPLMLLSSPWRLSLLFFVSGTATAFMMRRGTQGFAASRTQRLLIPLVFGMLVVVMPQAYYEVVEKAGVDESMLSFWADYLRADPGYCVAGKCLTLPTWNHLWFVAYLWVYSLLLWALVKLAPRAVDASAAFLGRHLTGAVLFIGPIAVLALIRIALVAKFPSTHAMKGDWFNHAQYGLVFLLGFLLAHQAAVWESLRRWRWPALCIAAASYLFIAWYFGQSGSVEVAPWLRNLQRVIYAADQWCAIAAILGFAKQWSPGDSPARRYLTEAVFPFYIVHQTAIVVMAHHLKPAGLSPAAEGPLLMLATLGVCFATFEIVRRLAWLRPLFGLAPARKPLRVQGETLSPAVTDPA
ncbi:acyltransferase family protein [Piscinibacter terrae]|uniref:Acetyltransferase n=1 Tax=Piscinibacter terrae TaxID=2496871 RepID=A0A3N7HKE0_9BURK|nr:acyltransferase family protein [Albitalea terrae]RQP22558.1 acetyltransferase [Albitalea terrae]